MQAAILHASRPPKENPAKEHNNVRITLIIAPALQKKSMQFVLMARCV